MLPQSASHAASASIPAWFKTSFLDFREDLTETNQNGKQFLILYFGQDDCGFCEKLLTINWRDPQIVAYTQKHFEVVALDIRGSRTLTDLKGRTILESKYAHENKFYFTPTLVFVDISGHEVFRLPGYRAKPQFKAALEYVVKGEYKKQPFKDYYAQIELETVFKK